MAHAPVTHYDVLDVPATATAEDIKKAHQRAMKTAHPDVGGNAGLFRLVQEAHETLSDPDRRAAYDRHLRDGSKNNVPPSQDAPRQDQHQEPPRQHRSEKPRTEPFRAMEAPPAPPAWTGPAVEFRPPLTAPANEGQKVRLPVSRGVLRWRKVLLIIGAVACIFPVLSMILAIGMYGADPIMMLTGVIGIVVTAGFWTLVAMTPWWIARRKKTPPATVLAGAILPEAYLTPTVHGVPGRDLSAARFGDRATMGAEGEKRTAHLITESVLGGLPAARLINGLRWPGAEHADIDHAVIAGNRIALIDSKMWADGDYWWDNKRLFKNGKELEAFKLGAAVASMRAAYPGCIVDGWVVLHSPMGKLNRPSVERAGMFPLPGRAPVRLVTPAELTSEVYTFLVQGDSPHAVEVPALASLLRSML